MRSMRETDGRKRSARVGRRVGILAFALIVSGITAVWTIQIVRQVWRPERGPAPASCREGVRELLTAVGRARAAAAREPDGERAALEQFRRALLPEWNSRSALSEVCRGDPRAEAALSQLDALRYAEEHAVRYEAVSLAEQRRQTDAMARELLGAPRR